MVWGCIYAHMSVCACEWHCGHASHPDVTCNKVHTETLQHKPCQCHHMLYRSTCMMCAHHKTMFLPFSLRHTTSSKCASSLTAHACVIHTSLTRCCDIPGARARPAGSQVSNPTATHLNPCANKDVHKDESARHKRTPLQCAVT